MNMFGEPEFKLGECVATIGAQEAFLRNKQYYSTFIDRHKAGDWGETCDEDKKLNEEAINPALHQNRVMSVYKLNDGTKIWIITEWDRSVTTVLLPEEY